MYKVWEGTDWRRRKARRQSLTFSVMQYKYFLRECYLARLKMFAVSVEIPNGNIV